MMLSCCTSLLVMRVGAAGKFLAANMLLVLLLFSLPNPATAKNAQTIKIDQAKAAFTLNIAKFVTWPEPFIQARSSAMRICLYHSAALSDAFSMIEGRRVGNRVVTQPKVVDSMGQSERCDVLFIPATHIQAFTSEVATQKPIPVLTIADATQQSSHGVARPGIVVSLVRKQSSMGLEVNIKEAENKQLKLSSELLKLANIIDGGGQ